MSHLLKIPILDSVYEELDDAFIDKKEDFDAFVWNLIRGICKDAKLGKLNKICVVNIIKNGQTSQDEIKLKNTTLVEIPNDPTWIPSNFEKEEIKYYEHQITDKTLKYLKLYASFAHLRHSKYSLSVQEYSQGNIKKLKENKDTKPDVIKNAQNAFEETKKTLFKSTPKCIEEVVYNVLSPEINKHISDNIDIEFDKENEELYPKEEKPVDTKTQK